MKRSRWPLVWGLYSLWENRSILVYYTQPQKTSKGIEIRCLWIFLTVYESWPHSLLKYTISCCVVCHFRLYGHCSSGVSDHHDKDILIALSCFRKRPVCVLGDVLKITFEEVVWAAFVSFHMLDSVCMNLSHDPWRKHLWTPEDSTALFSWSRTFHTCRKAVR